MNLPLSSYYCESKEKTLSELKQEADLPDLIKTIVLGLRVNYKRVLRLMRQNYLLCRRRRKRVKTIDSNPPYPVFPNLIRDLVTTSIDSVWVSDIT